MIYTPEGTHSPINEGGTETIVVLDDHPDTVDALTMALEAVGYMVEGYTEPDAGLARLLREPEPCLLIVDYLMWPMGGLEVVRRMRAAGVEVPVVCVTGVSPSRLDEPTLRQLGVSCILAKPVTLEAVERIVEATGRRACRDAG
jgi:DNA-binding response OmpR family regulator